MGERVRCPDCQKRLAGIAKGERFHLAGKPLGKRLADEYCAIFAARPRGVSLCSHSRENPTGSCVGCGKEFTAGDRVRRVDPDGIQDSVHDWAGAKRFQQCATDRPHVHDGCRRVPPHA